MVEGVGAHGCEYMTGGRAVILGPTGRNFAAGMSGGIAYVWDPMGEFSVHCNQDLVELDRFARFSRKMKTDEWELKRLIEAHVQFTGSTRGQAILNEWESHLAEFVRVIPTDYKKVLERRAKPESDRSSPRPPRISVRRIPVT